MEGDDPRSLPDIAYVQARRNGIDCAFDNKKQSKSTKHDEPPYAKGDARRQAWYDGFYHEQIRLNVGHILNRNGEEWE